MKEVSHKDHHLYNATDMKYPEQATFREKAESGCLGLGVGRRERMKTDCLLIGAGLLLRGTKCSEMSGGGGVICVVEYIKKHGLCTLNGWIIWYVNCIPIKL